MIEDILYLRRTGMTNAVVVVVWVRGNNYYMNARTHTRTHANHTERTAVVERAVWMISWSPFVNILTASIKRFYVKTYITLLLL